MAAAASVQYSAISSQSDHLGSNRHRHLSSSGSFDAQGRFSPKRSRRYNNDRRVLNGDEQTQGRKIIFWKGKYVDQNTVYQVRVKT